MAMDKPMQVGDRIEITRVIKHNNSTLGLGNDFFDKGHKATLVRIDVDGDWWAKFDHSGDTLCLQKGHVEYKFMP
jgi:hypothetical protein